MGLKQIASELMRESKALEDIDGTPLLAGERQVEAARLQEQARELEDAARLEDVHVWADSIIKQTKKGEKEYARWMAGWREGGKLRKAYLGSCKKMSRAEALQKARAMKAEALDGAGQELGRLSGSGDDLGSRLSYVTSLM
jgi:hypothetical protein